MAMGSGYFGRCPFCAHDDLEKNLSHAVDRLAGAGMITLRYAADDIVDRFPRNCGSCGDGHSCVCSLAIWLESPEKVGGTACVADLKRNFYKFQNIAKQNQRASSSYNFRAFV